MDVCRYCRYMLGPCLAGSRENESVLCSDGSFSLLAWYIYCNVMQSDSATFQPDPESNHLTVPVIRCGKVPSIHVSRDTCRQDHVPAPHSCLSPVSGLHCLLPGDWWLRYYQLHPPSPSVKIIVSSTVTSYQGKIQIFSQYLNMYPTLL